MGVQAKVLVGLLCHTNNLCNAYVVGGGMCGSAGKAAGLLACLYMHIYIYIYIYKKTY